MNQQNRNMNYQLSRDLPANGYGNRMERASNWSTMSPGTRNYNSNVGTNYNSNAGGIYPWSTGYNSNDGYFNNSTGNFPNNNNGSNANALVQLLSLMSTNASNSTQFSAHSPNIPQTSAAILNRGRSVQNNTNWSSKPQLKRSQGSKPEFMLQKAKEKRGPEKTTVSPSATHQKSTDTPKSSSAKPSIPSKSVYASKPTNAAKPANPAKPGNPTKPTNAAKTSNPLQPTGNKVAKVEQKSAPSVPIKVAVLPNNFPRDTLQAEDLAQLEEAIIDEVAIGHDKKIHFTGVEHRTNMLVVECKDWDTYGWLRATIPKLSGWKGVSLMAIMANRIPKTYNISVFLPRSSGKNPDQVLALIKAQNEGLRIDRWSIKSSTEENDGQSLIITIDGFSHKVISENGNVISYRYGTVPVVKLEELKTVYVKEENDSVAERDNNVDDHEEMAEVPENDDGKNSAD